MAARLTEISDALASAVERAAASVLRLEARRRGPSSALVWSADGLIVAAHHNVERDEEITVGLADGGTASARVVGRDPTTDVALLRVDAAGLAVPTWREPDDLRVGHLVLGLLRPGRSVRARLGIVHALGDAWRTPAGGRLDRYLETDLGVQTAFSGSLLVDADGRALGMNDAGLLRGTSLALPYPTLRRVVESLLAHGGVRRGFLGVGAVPVPLPGTPEVGGHRSGLLLASVQPASAAAHAGLLLGDVLLTADGQALASAADLLPILEEERIGTEVEVRYLRAGALHEARLTVAARGEAGR